VLRDGEAQDYEVTIGRESYKDWHTFALGIGISRKLGVDLIPDPDFSLVALGYSRNRQRGELHAPRNEFIRQINKANQSTNNFALSVESWRTWLAIFSVSGHRSILSQETVEPSQVVQRRRHDIEAQDEWRKLEATSLALP
jgi:hypothetical protein